MTLSPPPPASPPGHPLKNKKKPRRRSSSAICIKGSIYDQVMNLSHHHPSLLSSLIKPTPTSTSRCTSSNLDSNLDLNLNLNSNLESPSTWQLGSPATDNCRLSFAAESCPAPQCRQSRSSSLATLTSSSNLFPQLKSSPDINMTPNFPTATASQDSSSMFYYLADFPTTLLVATWLLDLHAHAANPPTIKTATSSFPPP
jgi:hypothetical protein